MEVGKYYTIKMCTRHPEDHSWRGDPFVLRHIEMPFVIMEFLAGQWEGDRHTFDTRDWEFMQVSTNFVDATKKQ